GRPAAGAAPARARPPRSDAAPSRSAPARPSSGATIRGARDSADNDAILRLMGDGRIGTEIGGYRVLEQIGHGGTSVVYLAEHVRLGRKAALKLLSPGFGDADFSDRFVRESQLAAGIDHPAILQVYDAGEANGVLYIAMAHVEGADLRALLAAEGPF